MNPRRSSCTRLGPLRAALPTELQRRGNIWKTYRLELGEAAFSVDGSCSRFVAHVQLALAALVGEHFATAVGNVAGLAEVRAGPVAEVLDTAALHVRLDRVPDKKWQR